MPAAKVCATPCVSPAAEHKPILAERFKTKACQNYEKTGACPYEARCMFAHGEGDLRTKEMNLRDNLTTEEAIKAFQRSRALAERSHDRKIKRKQQHLLNAERADAAKPPLAVKKATVPTVVAVPPPKSVWLQQQQQQLLQPNREGLAAESGIISVMPLSPSALADAVDAADRSSTQSSDGSHPDTVSAAKSPAATPLRRFRHDPYSPYGTPTPTKGSFHHGDGPATPLAPLPLAAACAGQSSSVLPPSVSPLAMAMRQQPSAATTPLTAPPSHPRGCVGTPEPFSTYGVHDVLLA